jgi:hypothetical protein
VFQFCQRRGAGHCLPAACLPGGDHIPHLIQVIDHIADAPRALCSLYQRTSCGGWISTVTLCLQFGERLVRAGKDVVRAGKNVVVPSVISTPMKARTDRLGSHRHRQKIPAFKVFGCA